MPPTFDLEALAPPAAQLQGADRQGLVLMQAAANTELRLFDQPCDYQLRFFAPGLGIEEDPVTGSAHALVAPWWMQQLGRDRVIGWQCSPRRGGMLCEQVQAGWVRLWDGQLQAGPCGQDPSGWQLCCAG
jgi:predicted PhzF superfamily epimerase YddE/YHI9